MKQGSDLSEMKIVSPDTHPDMPVVQVARPYAEDVSAYRLVSHFLRNRWLFVLIPLGLLIMVAGFTLLGPRTYSSSTGFVARAPQRGTLSGLAGVAAQFGVPLPNESAAESPAFYAYLVESTTILAALVADTFEIAREGRPAKRTLAQLLTDADTVAAADNELAVEQVRELIDVGRNRETGVVSVTVTTESAALSFGVARRVLSLVNEFNLSRRRSQAQAEREFIEERLAVAERELLTAEGELREFLRSNRQFVNSPDLQFQHDRLQRAVTMRQTVYTSLTQAYEEARIEEVRNIPVITVVQEATWPALPNGRGLIKRGLLTIIVGLMIAVAVTLFRAIKRSAGGEGKDYDEYRELRRQFLYDLRHPFRGLRLLLARN